MKRLLKFLMRKEINTLKAKFDHIEHELQNIANLINALNVTEYFKDEIYKHPGVQFVPPGHFYSPLPSIEEIKGKEDEIFHHIPSDIPGIDCNTDTQLYLLNEFLKYYQEQPFQNEKQPDLRFYFNNPSFPHGDAIFLFCFIRHLQPQKIIEIGSGHSSCVILDTNELFFNNAISCTFIDPYPGSLLSLVKPNDVKHIRIIPHKLQDIDTALFSELSQNDILFIDSTHVMKIYSDVNQILFKILPTLNPGVFIHFHDIAYPFEYPKEWIYKGIAWNEAYALRAFLQYNTSFKIQFFSTYLYHFYHSLIQKMPLCLENYGGNIWIKKEK